MREKTKLFLQKLEDDTNIEMQTTSQRNNKLWQTERLKRLTASNFGKVCKMRVNTSRAKTVENILYSKFSGSKATRWGDYHEKIARKEISERLDIAYRECGLFVHKTYKYLGASPDALICNDDGIIEIKCPFNSRHLPPDEGIRQKVIKYCSISPNGVLSLKKSHDYYYQIQGQLAVADKQYCIFVIWTPHGMLWERIERDDSFWTSKMEEKLCTFYLENMLPELVDPRYTRGLPIRQ